MIKSLFKTIGIVLMLALLGLTAGCGGDSSTAAAPSGGISGSAK